MCVLVSFGVLCCVCPSISVFMYAGIAACDEKLSEAKGDRDLFTERERNMQLTSKSKRD